jgi:hypothetical protein
MKKQDLITLRDEIVNGLVTCHDTDLLTVSFANGDESDVILLEEATNLVSDYIDEMINRINEG